MPKRTSNPIKVKSVPAVTPTSDVKPAPAAVEPAQPEMLGKCTCCIWQGPLQAICPVCGSLVVLIK